MKAWAQFFSLSIMQESWIRRRGSGPGAVCSFSQRGPGSSTSTLKTKRLRCVLYIYIKPGVRAKISTFIKVDLAMTPFRLTSEGKA